MIIDRPIAIALIIFIILLVVFFGVAPEYRVFKSLQSDLGIKKAEFNAKYDYYAAITKAYADLRAREDDIAKIDNALPASPELGQLVYYFQKTAAENGIIVKDLFLSKSSVSNLKENEGSVKEISFSLDLLGDYFSLGNFMLSLEKSSRLFEITNISFGSSSSTQAAPGQSQFQTQQISNFNLQIKTHSY